MGCWVYCIYNWIRGGSCLGSTTIIRIECWAAKAAVMLNISESLEIGHETSMAFKYFLCKYSSVFNCKVSSKISIPVTRIWF